jgi:hypothetical protein
MASPGAALDKSAALGPPVVAAVRVDLRLDFWLEDTQQSVELPRDLKRIDTLVESLYLCFGEPPVRSLFNALCQRVRTYQAEFDAVRPEESTDAKTRRQAEENRRRNPLLAPQDAEHSKPERRRRLDLVQQLIGRYIKVWDRIVTDEGFFLRWYERRLHEAARHLLGDKQDALAVAWETTYGIKPAPRKDEGKATKVPRLQEVVDAGTDVSDFIIAPEDPAARPALLAITRDLAGRWEVYLDEIRSLGMLKGTYGRKDAQVEYAMRRVEIAHQEFRDAAKPHQYKHPVAIVAAKRVARILRTYQVTQRPKDGEQELLLQGEIIRCMVDGYSATRTYGKELMDAFVFPPEGPGLEYEEPESGYFLRPSTAGLIAGHLTGNQFWRIVAFLGGVDPSPLSQLMRALGGNNPVPQGKDLSIQSVWTQMPIVTLIDKEMARPGGPAPDAADTTPGFHQYLQRMDADDRRLLALSSVPGTLANRARNEVQRCIGETRRHQQERYDHAKQAVLAGGLALAWSTGGASMVVAGALDAVFTATDTAGAVVAYRASAAKAALVMSSTEEAFWQAPSLCDLAQNVTNATLQVAGEIITDGIPARVIDALSVVLAAMEAK